MWSATSVCDVRKRQGMTISQVADVTGLSRVTIYAVERGEPATMDTLVKIARALDVSMSEICPEAAKVMGAVA